MTNKIYNLFISSFNRNKYENTNNFNIYFSKDEIITLKNDEYLNVNVVSFSMLNSMYNINQYTGNNTFTLQQYSSNNILETETNIVIPYGNYSVLTLRDALNSLLSNNIQIVYNYATNTYTFKKINNTKNFFIIPLKCNKLLGITDRVEIVNNGYTGTFVNMVDYQQIILKSPSFMFETCSLDNIQNKSNFVSNSDFLFWFNKQDIEPFKTINYRNEDCNTNFCYNLQNRYINLINLQIVNEYDELIQDCPDYLLQLQFTVTERKDNTIQMLLIQLLRVINDIHFILLNFINIFRRAIKI